ncbi:MAG TPA: hypothetical protein DGG95_14995, partial [Cytophagales bacterium]|nr:hypothetical protein [Cytophagales bacterium]
MSCAISITARFLLRKRVLLLCNIRTVFQINPRAFANVAVNEIVYWRAKIKFYKKLILQKQNKINARKNKQMKFLTSMLMKVNAALNLGTINNAQVLITSTHITTNMTGNALFSATDIVAQVTATVTATTNLRN